MRCADTEKLIKKYELGEIDFLEKRILQKHLERCPVCKKRYAGAMALNVLLAQSAKSATPSLLKNIFGGSLVKYVAGLITVGIIGVGIIWDNPTDMQDNMSQIQDEAISSEVKTSTDIAKPLLTESSIQDKAIQDTKKENGFKIRAISGQREIELSIDGENGQIESREEK